MVQFYKERLSASPQQRSFFVKTPRISQISKNNTIHILANKTFQWLSPDSKLTKTILKASIGRWQMPEPQLAETIYTEISRSSLMQQCTKNTVKQNFCHNDYRSMAVNRSSQKHSIYIGPQSCRDCAVCQARGRMCCSLMSRMLRADWASPVLLTGSSAVRRPVAHHPQVAVLQHDALTLPERLPLIWERTWHDGFLMRRTVQEI